MNIYNLFYKAPAPEGIEERNAHIIGGGMAGLAAAVFLIDDAGMPGKNITLYEKRNSLGGCCDAYSGEAGYICPGERELEPFMECLWYLCSKIPSLEDPSISVLDESVRANKDKFLSHIDKTKWMSFFLTVEDYPEFFERLEKMTGSKSGTGGGITFMDSGWEMSLVIYDRDYFPDQREKNRDVLWGDGLFGERIGSYIKKPMAECTGNEIIEEMLYHFGMLDMKDEVLAHSHISTCMMPYITSQFMPRKESDRPTIIPKDCTNLALIGQYVEVPRDVVFTIETSVRTPLEAVYMLTGLDKEIIEVNPARYDLRYIKERVMKFGGMKGKITEEDLPKINPLKLWLGKAKLIKELLKKANEIPPYYIMYPGRDKSIALMLHDFEAELEGLTDSITQDQQELDRISRETVNAEKFLALVKKYTDFSELTPAMINEFVEKILVHQAEGKGASRTQEVEIFFNFIGKVEIPRKEIELTEEEKAALAEQERRRAKKAEYNRRYMEKKRRQWKEQQEREKEQQEALELPAASTEKGERIA